MKILIYSRAFPPIVGGMCRLMEMLAEEFVRQGHDVEVFTEIGGEGPFPFPVHRRAGFFRLWRAARRSDVILSAPLSLRALGPLFLSRRAIAVAHPEALRGGGLTRVKRALTHLVTNIVPSRFMAQSFPNPVVILNTYDERLFHWPDDNRPRANVLFVGRLEEWKACRTLLQAFALVAGDWPDLGLTIVGGGPDRAGLERMAADLGIAARVDFAGILLGSDLADAMARHQVMVVPSVGPEPFGIVALEGLASGCRVIVARSGGLPEAVGSCAALFAPGDAEELAARLREAISAPEALELRAAVKAHLRRFAPEVIGAEYLAVFRRMIA